MADTCVARAEVRFVIWPLATCDGDYMKISLYNRVMHLCVCMGEGGGGRVVSFEE